MSKPVAFGCQAGYGAWNTGLNHAARAGLEIGLSELEWARKQFPGDNRRQNAIRHAAWTAMMSFQFGENHAREIAYAHEKYGSDGWEDTIVDFSNNEVGYAIANFYRGTGGTPKEDSFQEVDTFFHSLILQILNGRNRDFSLFKDEAGKRIASCKLVTNIDQVDFAFGNTTGEMIRFYKDEIYYLETDKPIRPGDRKPMAGGAG